MQRHLAAILLSFGSAVSAMTPSEALDELMQGNGRYMAGTPLESPALADKRAELAAGQAPFAVILGCSDSRVPPEIIFDQGPGELFIVRVAGNVAGLTEIESINYAVKQFHSSLILVLGHASCGAITAVRESNTAEIPAIASLVKPAIAKAKDLEEAIEANVLATIKTLKNHPLLKSLFAAKKIDCVGAYYHLETGEVELLEYNTPKTATKKP